MSSLTIGLCTKNHGEVFARSNLCVQARIQNASVATLVNKYHIFEVVIISQAGLSPADLKAGLGFVVLWVWLCWAELIWAGPVGDDWVEPVWFLLPELCCLCRVFVPATQAPTVINSPGSLCMLTHTDKKWWRERERDGGRVRQKAGRWQAGSYSGACWHRRTKCNSLKTYMLCMYKRIQNKGDGWQNTRLKL